MAADQLITSITSTDQEAKRVASVLMREVRQHQSRQSG